METSSKRLSSLDFFRGATVAAMIMVNDPGSWDIKYYQLSHAKWEGCTATDLIFPFFLFIVGVSISLAFGKALEKGLPKKYLLLKLLKRGLIIFLLGLFLNLFPVFNFSEFRIPGVLQRIALVYVFCSILYLFASRKSQYIWFGGILLGYYIIMTFVPVPDIGPANLEPTTNFSAWFDRFILEGNIGRKGKGVYDSTGIFTTIPAIASGLSGVFTGHLLASKKMDAHVKLIWLFVAGCALLLSGWIWSMEFPMIKRLWTSSFVLYTSGLAVLCFAISYWFIDILNYQKMIKPFLAFGSNALIAYFVAGIFGHFTSAKFLEYGNTTNSIKDWMFSEVFSTVLSPYNASFAYSIANTLLIFILVWWMYKKNIIIKV
ncbi:MAG: heparan-alpha-glucosaminide N-acetyltransferase domain-containing protein [Flavobacteriaceae bacterium]